MIEREYKYNLTKNPQSDKSPLVGVIMGSRTDAPVMLPASYFLEDMRAYHEFKVVSAHRTPDLMYEYVKTARERGIVAIIAGAGGRSAHLPGMVASIDRKMPVVGVPIGEEAIPSVLGMPTDVPVGAMDANKAKNAAIYVVSWLSLFIPDIAEAYDDYLKNGERQLFQL